MTDDSNKPTVLFVDDEYEQVQNVREYMEKDWMCEHLPSGEECVSRIRQGDRWNLIIMDAQLPPGKLHGLDALRLILREVPQQCVVFLSGKEVYADHAIAALQAGATDYIQKPVRDMAAFEERMKRAMEVCNQRFETLRDLGVLEIAKAVFHQVLPRVEAAYFRTDTLAAEATDAARKGLEKIKVNLMQAEKYLRRLTEFNPKEIRESSDTADLRAEARAGVDSIEQLLELKLDKPNVKFVKPDEAPEARIRFDSRWPSLITEILVQNAAEAVLASERSEKEVRVDIQQDPDKKEWQLIVEDTGDGIPEEVRGKLGQLGVTTKKGMGLGLYLVNQVADMKVEDLNPGTRITVSFPKA